MWYYERLGAQVGPVDGPTLQHLVQAGQVTPATLVWREGFQGWTAAGQTELAAMFAPLPPALPAQMGLPPMQMAYTPTFPVPQVLFAGFWIRFVAYVIDAVILGIPLTILAMIGGGMMSVAATDAETIAAGLIVILGELLLGLVAIAYFVFFVSGGWQATPGKRLLGLRIVPVIGGRMGFGRAVGRYFAYFLSSLFFGFGFLMIGWTTQKRGLHDMIAETRVIYARR